MAGMIKKAAEGIGLIYVGVGFVIVAIKLASLFAWLPYDIVAGQRTLDGHVLSTRGVVLVGIVGPFITGLTWPVAAYRIATGSASLGETLFFPFVLPERCQGPICGRRIPSQ